MRRATFRIATGPRVTLRQDQIDYAIRLGTKRQRSAEEKGRKNSFSVEISREQQLANNIEGASGEFGFAAWLHSLDEDLPWHRYAEKITNLPDFGDFIDIKTGAKPNHQLIVQKWAKKEFAYVLVNAHDHPTYEVVGWLWGEEVMIPTLLCQKRYFEAYFASENILRPPSELLQVIRSRRKEK